MRHGSFCLLWAASSPLCEGPRGDFYSPKSSKTEGNVMSPSCWAAHHRQSSKLASTAGGLSVSGKTQAGPGREASDELMLYLALIPPRPVAGMTNA